MTNENPTAEQTLREWSPQQFAQEFNLVNVDEQIHRTKENNYMFISFEDVQGERTHVYLSIGLSDEVSDDDTALTILKGKRIMETINSSGELRVKLSRNGGNKVALQDLFATW
jgi:hypothetical protein